MKIGAIYPQTELPPDPTTVKTFVQTVQELGFAHVLVYDHVVGADPEIYQDSFLPYDVDTTFHEPLVFFGYLAALTTLELVTGILISPQRPTALIAKQAAEVDILTGGRFRLGIGVGWNRVEYDALGQDFRTRGRRQEEQIGLLRRFWTERVVNHEGMFDQVRGAGIAPLPVQRPIPIWLGGSSTAAYHRIGRYADGWFPLTVPGPRLEQSRAEIARAASAAGRDPSSIGMEGRVSLGPGGETDIAREAEKWDAAGATHLTVNTMHARLHGLDAHLDGLAGVASALDLPRPPG